MSTLETNLIQPSTGTALTIGASGDTITVPSGATFNVAGTLQSGGSAITQGITEADFFVCNADQSITNSTRTLVSGNWQRSAVSDFSKIGTGMTESSGIFTFPSTGIYLVEAQADIYANSGALNFANVAIDVTTNNSSYNERTNSWNSNYTTNAYSSTYKKCFVDVTDTSNVKVKIFTYASGANYSLRGNADKAETCAIFIRLGDT